MIQFNNSRFVKWNQIKKKNTWKKAHQFFSENRRKITLCSIEKLSTVACEDDLQCLYGQWVLYDSNLNNSLN